MKLSHVIDELVEERGLNRSVLASIVIEGMLAAYQKKYPELVLQAGFNEETGDLEILIEKEVISTVENEDSQISVKKARHIDKDLKEGDKIWLPFEGTIGRVEVLRARQIIASQIRKIEALAVFNMFKDRQGEILHGVIHKCERGGMSIKIDDETLAFLPRSLTSPTDKCIVGYPIRAMLKEVLPEPRNDNQLVLDRTSEDFLQHLFELEIPEIFEKLVEIRSIVRAPGYKSKIAVVSNDQNIDPVGTCVGVGGSRIKPILKEIGGEKIDVIPWGESAEKYVAHALKPAEVNKVEIDGSKARVWLDDDQRSLAIGRMGQNITLASRLTGFDIQLIQKESDTHHQDSVDHESDEAAE